METCRFYLRLHIWVIKALKIVRKTSFPSINILMYSSHSTLIYSFFTKIFESSKWDLKRDLICAWLGKPKGQRGVHFE